MAPGVVNVASQLGRLRQKTHKASAGGRRGVLLDLGPPWVEAVTVGHEAASRPLFSTLALVSCGELPPQAGAEGEEKGGGSEEEEGGKRSSCSLVSGHRHRSEGWTRSARRCSASLSAQLGRRKRKKLPRTSSLRGTRLQGAYAKVTGSHCASSSCPSGVSCKPDLPGLRGSVGGDTRLRVRYCRVLERPRPHWWLHVRQAPGVQSFQGLGLPVDFVPTSLVNQHVLRCSVWRHLGCHRGGQCRQGSGSVQFLLGVLCLPGGGFSVGADVGWIPR